MKLPIWLSGLLGRHRRFEPSAEQQLAEEQLRRQAEVVEMLEQRVALYEQILGLQQRGRPGEHRKSA